MRMCGNTVSYTHLDVYKRQSIQNCEASFNHIRITQNEIDKLVEEVQSMMTEQTMHLEFI